MLVESSKFYKVKNNRRQSVSGSIVAILSDKHEKHVGFPIFGAMYVTNPIDNTKYVILTHWNKKGNSITKISGMHLEEISGEEWISFEKAWDEYTLELTGAKDPNLVW